MEAQTISPSDAGASSRSQNPTRPAAIGLALLVTVLWSTSWVLIRFGLKEVPALTFAGLRYTLAAACLVPFLFTRRSIEAIRSLNRAQWGQLLALGVVFYAVAQGAQYLSLVYLSLATTSLIINLTTVTVAGFGLFLLSEAPTRLQWIGIILNLSGIALFFLPASLHQRCRFGDCHRHGVHAGKCGWYHHGAQVEPPGQHPAAGNYCD